MCRKLPYLMLVITVLFFPGCMKTSTSEPAAAIGEITDHAVTLEQAKKIALLHSISPAATNAKKGARYTFKEEMDQMEKSLKSQKKISNYRACNYTQSQSSFYIINFEGGGFAIVAGDDRVKPVLAYSDTNVFPLDSNRYAPSALVSWLADTDDHIRNIRRQNGKQSQAVKAAWDKMNVQSKALAGVRMEFPPCYTDGETYSTFDMYGPYLETNWGQGEGYNDGLSNMGCPLYTNGRPPTGCVATALGQIMAFHQRPTTYNWSAMPDNAGSTTTAQLMVDLGVRLNMSYGCNGSSTYTSYTAPVLMNGYHYTSAEWHDNYDAATVFSNLTNGRPVILSGGRQEKWWFFNVYDDGHAWVCDGARWLVSYICHYGEDDGDPYSIDYEWLYNYQVLDFHMNWGWSGSANGYYFTDNFNPAGNTYNYKREMVVNIVP